MNTDEKGFLRAIKKNPTDATTRAAYADWLDEHERPYEAALQRSQAGLSEVFFKLRRKSDGLFSTATRPNAHYPMNWSPKGKMWRTLSALHSHLRGPSDLTTYGGTAWDDVEVVVIEVRVTYSTTLPITTTKHPRWATLRPTVAEPLGGHAYTSGEVSPDAPE